MSTTTVSKDVTNPIIQIQEDIVIDSRDYEIKGFVDDESEFFVELDGVQITTRDNLFTLKGSVPVGKSKLQLLAFDKWGNETTKDIIVERVMQVTSTDNVLEPLKPENLKSKNNKFTVTDKAMTRFNLTLENAINFVLQCSYKMCGGEIFVPKLKSYNIIQLCNVINPNAEIEFTGIRPGEKIHECMINSVEIDTCYDCDKYFIILSFVSIMCFNYWFIRKFKDDNRVLLKIFFLNNLLKFQYHFHLKLIC